MIKIENIGRDLAAIRAKSPLIHNITNFVVMNNTANALLAIGASPVMAHSIDEVADMVSIASALVLNIGTLDLQQVGAMVVAGRAAIQRGIPIILDPVGAGATPYRTSVCRELIEECRPSIIRGNSSEIQALYSSSIVTKGVDSTHSSESALASAQALAGLSGAVVVVSGETDYITDGTQTESVNNGSPIMQRVTGMGCTATAIVAAFAAVNPNYLEASTHAMAIMGICGQRAAAYSKGTGSLQVNFLDELYNLDITVIENCLKNPPPRELRI